MHKIIPSLSGLAVSIDTLTPDPDNARVHSDRNIDAIAASLRAYGQRKPIVVQKTGMVVRAGNGTLDAARRLGWDEIAAVVVDEEDVTASAFGLADNRTAELAAWDEPTLARVLSEIRAEDAQIDPMSMGWEEREVVKLLADYGSLFDYEPPVDEDLDEDSDGDSPPAEGGMHELPAHNQPQIDTRMVQLFYDEEQHAAFMSAVRAIAAKHGDTDVSSVVLRAVQALNGGGHGQG